MNNSNSASTRSVVMERLAQVPDDALQTVLAFVDQLIAQQQKSEPNYIADNAVPPEEITTWEQWFDEVRDLPEIPELINLTKQKQQAIITEGLVADYESQSLTADKKEQ